MLISVRVPGNHNSSRIKKNKNNCESAAYNSWTDTLPDSEGLLQAVLVGVQREGTVHVEEKALLIQTARADSAVPRDTEHPLRWWSTFWFFNLH